jgi:hypothetical protein
VSPTETIAAGRPKEYVKLEWAARWWVVGGWHIPIADSLHGRFALLVLFDFSIILSSSYYFLDKSKKMTTFKL